MMTVPHVTAIETITAQRKFGRDALRLILGTVTSQLLIVGSMPVLTWLFAPEEFGVAAMFLAVTTVVGVAASLRYELAIVLPDTDAEAANLLGLSILVSVVFACIIGVIEALTYPLLVHWIKLPNSYLYLVLFPVAVALNGIVQSLNYWQTRKREYNTQSFGKISGNSLQVGLGIGFGFTGLTQGLFLIFAQLIGQLTGVLVLLGLTLPRDGKLLWASIHPRDLWIQAIKYRKFPLVECQSAILNLASSNLPVVLLGLFFPLSTVGFYALGNRVLNLPMSLIGRSVAQVFFQSATEALRENRLSNLVVSTVRRLFQLTMLPFLLCGAVGEEAFLVVFGSEWAVAGWYAQILAPWLFLQFLYVPISNLTIVLGLQEFGLMFNGFLLASRAASIVTGGLCGDANLAIILFSGTSCLLYLGFFTFILVKANVDQRVLGIRLLSDAWPTLVACGFSILQQYAFPLPPLATVLVAMASCAIPLGHILISRNNRT